MTDPSVDDGGYEHPSPWDSPGWRADALVWISGGLAAHGLARSAPLEVRVRPWSVVIRVPVDDPAGPVWFKANPPGSAWEPALMRALAGWAPERVLAPLAVDTERAWSLNRDGGVHGSLDAPTMVAYAALQRATADRVDELIAMGLPDLRPAALPACLDDLLARHAVPELKDAAVRSRISDWCAELAGTTVPATIDHSDLHERQIFAGPRFFDWGDASVAHPFTSLLVPARVLRHRHGDKAGGVIERLRDAYLSSFDLDLDSARRAARLACRLGAIGRATTWGRVFPAPGAAADGTGQITAWLARLVDEPPV